MASTTSGWQYAVPNDTLVAWPAVSQAVADKLETNLGNYQPGLALVKTQTIGTGVSSVTVTGAFSSTYDNYKILITGGAWSGTASAVYLRLGSANTNYKYALTYVAYTGGGVATVPSATATVWDYAGSSTSDSINFNIDIKQPFLTKYTYYSGAYSETGLTGNTSGLHQTAASYTDFTIGTATGSLTGGTIAVYGYRK